MAAELLKCTELCVLQAWLLCQGTQHLHIAVKGSS
jgi:hypothetical protein